MEHSVGVLFLQSVNCCLLNHILRNDFEHEDTSALFALVQSGFSLEMHGVTVLLLGLIPSLNPKYQLYKCYFLAYGFAWAATVALTCIIMEAHYLTDTAVDFLVGTLCVYFISVLFSATKRAEDLSVHPVSPLNGAKYMRLRPADVLHGTQPFLRGNEREYPPSSVAVSHRESLCVMVKRQSLIVIVMQPHLAFVWYAF